MALINRVARLFTADMHAVLDRLEEPEVLLRHAVREMEEELAHTEQSAKLVAEDQARQTKRRLQVAAALAELDAQIGIAFDADNEALARKLVKRKLETERLEKHLAERCEALEETLEERRAVVVEQRERLDAIRQKAEILLEAPDLDVTAQREPDEFSVGEDELEVAWLREKQRRARS